MAGGIQETAEVYECPTCGQVFLEEGPRDVHHTQSHGERLVDRPVYQLLDHEQKRVKAKRLRDAGYETESDLEEAAPEDLLKIRGIGKTTLADLARNMDNPPETDNPFMPGPSESEEEAEERDSSIYPQIDA